MPATAANSTFDIALWFVERARSEDSYLQAQKLQRMLWLAQGQYAKTYHGRKLMPAVFVAQEVGPVEPNIFRAFELGRPHMPDAVLMPEVEDFLIRLWGRFGHHETEHLNTVVRGHEVFRKALREGEGEEIPFAEIAKFFQREMPRRRPQKVIRDAQGREWKKWVPRKVK